MYACVHCEVCACVCIVRCVHCEVCACVWAACASLSLCATTGAAPCCRACQPSTSNLGTITLTRSLFITMQLFSRSAEHWTL